jgi:F0F1-type ATP synthase assembly protein I
VLAQLSLTLVLAVAALALGEQRAIALACGGLITVLGSAAFALPQFGGRLTTPERMLRLFFAAGALKWVVLGLGWYVGIAVWKLPFLPMLTGFVAAQVASVWVLFKTTS